MNGYLCKAGRVRKWDRISVEEVAREWQKNPKFVAAYDALEEEFALADALIEAWGRADMTQEEVAQAIGTTQAFVARLEGGRNMPSTRTLKSSRMRPAPSCASVFRPIKRRHKLRDSASLPCAAYATANYSEPFYRVIRRDTCDLKV